MPKNQKPKFDLSQWFLIEEPKIENLIMFTDKIVFEIGIHAKIFNINIFKINNSSNVLF